MFHFPRRTGCTLIYFLLCGMTPCQIEGKPLSRTAQFIHYSHDIKTTRQGCTGCYGQPVVIFQVHCPTVSNTVKLADYQAIKGFPVLRKGCSQYWNHTMIDFHGNFLQTMNDGRASQMRGHVRNRLSFRIGAIRM